VTAATATDTALAADRLGVVARIHRLATQRVRTLLPYARAQPAVGDRRAQFGAAMRPGSTRRVASCAQGKSSIVSPRWYSEDTDGANGKTDRPNSNLDQAVVKQPVPVRAVGLRRCSEAVEQAIWTRPRILLRIGFGGVYHRCLGQMCWEPQASWEYLRCKPR
jgi:hypothetical protein